MSIKITTAIEGTPEAGEAEMSETECAEFMEALDEADENPEETGERIVDEPAEYEMRIEGLNQNPILCDVVALCQRQQRQIDALSALLVEKGVLTQEEIDNL